MTDESDLRLHHLDTVQSVINRLSQNSFTIRGWSVTLASAIIAFASTRSSEGDLVILALVPAWIFWGMDAYYLRQERLFRQLHDAAARRLIDNKASPDIPPFHMGLDFFQDAVAPWRRLMFAPNVVAIPAVLTVVTISVLLFEAISG
jgi:hypothetical protein